jgi:flagellar secretion chaperone FliS
MYQSGCNVYRKSAGNIVEDNQVVLLKLYDGLLRFLSIAKRGILEKKPNIRGENISSAMAIITELDAALDMKAGGEISTQLASLYRFVMTSLTTANVKNDLTALAQAENILITLKEGFEAAVQKQKLEARVAMAPNSAIRSREGVRVAF